MAEALAQALAEVDDPEIIQQLLTDLDDDSPPHQSSEQPSLETLYDRYLVRRQNRSPATRAQYKRTLPQFISYATDQEITVPKDMSTGFIDSYVDKLFDEFDADATILTYTKNVRAWLRWLSKRDLCESTIYHILDKDELGLSPTARDVAIPKPQATHILQRLRQQRRGSAEHALLEFAWNGGPRLGGIHSVDVSDFDPDSKSLVFRHRPETGTRLKNGSAEDDTSGDGERDITLHPRVVDALQLYIETERPDVTDAYGREPLFATTYGRADHSTLRRWIYDATSCRWAVGGPDDITCDGSCDPDSNVCPHSYYPHAIRRGAIVAHLSGGLRPDRVSGRFDVSTKVIKDHYDPRVKTQEKEDREAAVKDAWSDF